MTLEHRERIFAAIASGAAAHSAVVASWQRSVKLYQLDPEDRRPPQRLTDPEISRARERVGRLLAAAQPSLDRLYMAVGSAGCCVLFADRDGVQVDRRGAGSDDRWFQEWGLWPGFRWDEETEGTNGIGTCLVEGRPITIHRDDHFFSGSAFLSCTSAPIFDHEGNLAGAIDVSSCREDLSERFVGLISLTLADTIRRIEMDELALAFPDARLFLVPRLGRNTGGVLAVDRNDVVVGATNSARVALRLTHEHLAGGLTLSAVLQPDTAPAASLAEVQQATMQRALAVAGGNISEAARHLGISRATLHRKLNQFGLRQRK